MKYSYFPGCTLKNKAVDLDHYARVSAEALGFELEEISEWQCCGGVYPLGTDEIATKLASVRALNDAKEHGQDLVTVCSACHHVIKRVNDDMKNVDDIRTRANNYMKLDEPYAGETTVLPCGIRRAEEKSRKAAHRQKDRRLLRLPSSAPWQTDGL